MCLIYSIERAISVGVVAFDTREVILSVCVPSDSIEAMEGMLAIKLCEMCIFPVAY